MASPEKTPDELEHQRRREALDQAVRLSITAHSWTTPGVVGTAEAFYSFLSGEGSAA